jgi:cell division protein ZapA
LDNLTINITIAEKQYRLTVARADEEKVRKAVSLINDTMRSYSKHYSFKDNQDLLAMAALQFATTVVKQESEKSFDSQHLERKLNELNTLLSETEQTRDT